MVQTPEDNGPELRKIVKNQIWDLNPKKSNSLINFACVITTKWLKIVWKINTIVGMIGN
jgi:hypothetical protein